MQTDRAKQAVPNDRCAASVQQQVAKNYPSQPSAHFEPSSALDCFEIWSRENWDQEALSLDEEMQNEEVRREIDELGI